MKAIIVGVYKFYTDCTNGGVSSKNDYLFMECADGYLDVDEENPPENLVRLCVNTHFDKKYYYLEPVAPKKEGCVGWMMGGNFAYSSDSRFPFNHPIAIHDRQEDYEAFNRFMD